MTQKCEVTNIIVRCVNSASHCDLFLSRSQVADKIISSEPTLSDMDPTDVGFKLMIENTLQNISVPAHRYLVIETLTIMSAGLVLR